VVCGGVYAWCICILSSVSVISAIKCGPLTTVTRADRSYSDDHVSFSVTPPRPSADASNDYLKRKKKLWREVK